jgi:hypothetical protein
MENFGGVTFSVVLTTAGFLVDFLSRRAMRRLALAKSDGVKMWLAALLRQPAGVLWPAAERLAEAGAFTG